MNKMLLNRENARQVLRLFDYCFKQGVIDAMEYDDNYTAEEFVDEVKENLFYGLLGEFGMQTDWKHWRMILYRFCRMANLPRVGAYVDAVRKLDFQFCVIPMAMRFYAMGVEEWVEFPSPTNMAIFKVTPYIHWKPMKSHMRHMKVDDFISYVQEFCFERRYVAEEARKKDAKDFHYEGFCQALWQLTRKDFTYGKIRKGIPPTKKV